MNMIKNWFRPKTAIFIDGSNIFWGVKKFKEKRKIEYLFGYEKLKNYLEERFEPILFRYYGCEDTNPLTEEHKEKAKRQRGFYNKLEKVGIEIFKKPLQYIQKRISGDIDSDIKTAIRKCITNKEITDIVLLSGDKHFLPIVKECHNAGKYVHIYSFKGLLSEKLEDFTLQQPRCNCVLLDKVAKKLEYTKIKES